jgi:O-antigen/teichoic acid export membrane protein
LDTPRLDRAVAAGGWAFLARTLVGASGFARTLVLARLLSPHDFGVMATALVILGAIETFTATGFETALIQRRDDVDLFYDSAFTVQALRGLVLAALLWLTAPAAAAFFHGPALVPVLRAVGLVVVLRGLANPAKVHLFRELRYETLFWWSLPEVVVALGLAIGLGIVLRNVWALVVPVIASQLVATVVSHIIARRRVRLALDWTRLREIGRYSRWVLAAQVMTFLSVQGDNAFVARVLGIGPLGFYQVAFRIAELPVTGFTQVVNQVALPSLSALHGERDRLKAWYFAAQRVVLLANGAFAAAILLFGAQFTRALLGPSWMPILPALRILAVAMILRSVVTAAGVLFNALGEPRLTYRLHGARLAIMAATIYPLSRMMAGLEGVAVSVLVSLLGAALVYGASLRAALGVGWIEQLRRLTNFRRGARAGATRASGDPGPL